MKKPPIFTLLILSLAACGGNDPEGAATTRLDTVDVEPGSISDSMIILDDASSDGAAGDETKADDGAAKPGATSSDNGAKPSGPEDESGSEDAVIVPGGVRKASAGE